MFIKGAIRIRSNSAFYAEFCRITRKFDELKILKF